MFDLSSSKLLLLAVIALIVVGPKDLPVLLRTVGKYIGMIRRQAGEFRTQFEDAMRESELTDLKKEVEQLGAETSATLHDATSTIESKLDEVGRDVDNAGATPHESQDQAAPADTRALEDAIPRTAIDAAALAIPAALQPPVAAEPPVGTTHHTEPANADGSAPASVPARTGA